MICKTANLRTLCLPVLLFVLSTFSAAFSSYKRDYTRSYHTSPLSLVHSESRLDLSYFLRARVPRPMANTHTNSYCHSLALAVSIPSLLPTFPHPCGTSRKLYVPTLATLNAGLARDNPRPSPPPSAAVAAAAASFSASAPPEPSAVLYPSLLLALRAAPFLSSLTDGPPGFTTS